MALRRSWLVMAAILAAPRLAAAQLDYRNLDDDRPTLIEDAYSVERYAFEFLAAWRYTRSRGGERVHSFVSELEHGLFANFHLGLKLPVARTETGSGVEWGIAGLRAFALYNFNTESQWLPALGLRADASLPVGSLAGEGTRFTIKAIATRSWGPTRIHVNASHGFGSDRALAVADATHEWWLGAAIDRTLFRQSTLLIAEIYALRPVAEEPVEVNGSLGLRYQWTPVTVLDLGVTRRLRRTGPDFELTLGFSRAFALAGLLPKGP